ncbi:YTH domain-containing protein ECT2-like isoform X2 [Musa acuminata AAA Group]|uniref:YTH domain-containing protein ECT2-like isoform X2 n=2 Tax=Musa acuminata AAA Group TaxID=214697 RepID=UPI0031D9BD38
MDFLRGLKDLSCFMTLTFHDPAIEDALKKLKIDLPAKVNCINTSGPKGGSQYDSTSCISSGDAGSSTKESEVDQEPLVGEQGMYYYGYYYPGSTGLMGEWDDQYYIQGSDSLQVQHPAVQAENGSFVYYFPGYQAGYPPYSPVLPGAIYGVDGQFLSQGSYYPSSVSPQTLVSPGVLPQPVAYGPELVPAYPWDPSFFFTDEIQGSISVDPTNPHYKPNLTSHAHTRALSKTIPTSKSVLGIKGSSLASDVSHPITVQNQAHKPVKKGAAAVLSKGYVPISKFNVYANQGKGELLCSKSAINLKENGRSWIDDEKLKVKNKLNSHGDFDLLNEQNRGPRTNGSRSSSQSGVDPLEALGAEKNDSGSISSDIVNKDEYNRPDFQTKYEHALFFVIKSYSEDDIHKSIKYNVWASTPNGNKRLDNAFQVAQEKMAEKNSKCPVFLFFSVNASGQFCGVAEMTGRVDFSKDMDFWQQDKWNGFFPVKWHIIKDVPNPQFRHIILENNDNKPVTNSRDTQEVKFSQGTEMLSIFKSYSFKTSILDDFGFYENRQKVMQEKRNRPNTPSLVNSLPRNNEPIEVPKIDDSKSKTPNLVLIEVEDHQTGIPTSK